MEEIAKVTIEEFKKESDGSWVCVKNADITTKSGRIIRVSPRTTFKKGFILSGLDVASALDEVIGQ